MTNSALAVLETALRARKLDRTLTTALPPLERSDPTAFVPFDITPLDAGLHGGLPRGQVSEFAGAHSSGRTTLLLQLIATTTRRGEIAALVDTCDRLDLSAASNAGIDLDRLLWIRGDGGPIDRIVDRAIKALTLVLQAGGFALVAIDLADVPPRVLRSLPFTTWLRVQRSVEGSDTACLVVSPEPLGRSAGGLTVMCSGQTKWSGADHARRMTGLDTAIRVVSPRRRVESEVSVAAFTN
jgi:recombination protein RecA